MCGVGYGIRNARRLKSPHAKHLPTVSDYAQFGRPNMVFEKHVINVL